MASTHSPIREPSELPIRTDGSKWEVIQGFALDEFAKQKIQVTCDELQAERAEVKELIS